MAHSLLASVRFVRISAACRVQTRSQLAGTPEEQVVPRRTDLNHVLVIGSGPIVIGQACEFDYSGTQACRVLRAEGLQVSLVNSNPATIMTDPEFADHTYVEPITPRSSSASSPNKPSAATRSTRCWPPSAGRPR